MLNSIINFLYNLDRAFASLFGAKPQNTISSEMGRSANPVAKAGCDMLDVVDANHCTEAVAHADKLEAVDDGVEK